MQNRHTRERGEFFKITSNYYLSGYCNKEETEYERYCILDMCQFKRQIKENVNWLSQIRYAPNENSSFMFVSHNDIPKHCYMYRSWVTE